MTLNTQQLPQCGASDWWYQVNEEENIPQNSVIMQPDFLESRIFQVIAVGLLGPTEGIWYQIESGDRVCVLWLHD